MSDGNDSKVYTYRGKKEEEVPETVEKLIVKEGVQTLPDGLCEGYELLQTVTLPSGLTSIGCRAFCRCKSLLEITIGNTVRYIGKNAFEGCANLIKLEFEFSRTSPPQLHTIDDEAFTSCNSLQRVKLPSSVTSLGESIFAHSEALVAANLSATSVTEIPEGAFSGCPLLQTVSLPKTVEQIGVHAFSECPELVTVVVPFNTKSISVDMWSFAYCGRLSNLVLPKGSAVHAGAFDCGSDHLFEEYGQQTSHVASGLMGRFDGYIFHRMSYDHSAATADQEMLLQECSFIDEFGMTPFHVLFLTVEPNAEMLEVLLGLIRDPILLNETLRLRDEHGRRALDYALRNWNDVTKNLVLRTLEKSIIEPVSRWGSTPWVNSMQSMVQETLDEEDRSRREILCDEAYALLERYENIQVTSILEMALWKAKLKSGWTTDGSKRQNLDREECRCISGSNVAVPHVVAFLGIPRASFQEDDSSEE